MLFLKKCFLGFKSSLYRTGNNCYGLAWQNDWSAWRISAYQTPQSWRWGYPNHLFWGYFCRWVKKTNFLAILGHFGPFRNILGHICRTLYGHFVNSKSWQLFIFYASFWQFSVANILREASYGHFGPFWAIFWHLGHLQLH